MVAQEDIELFEWLQNASGYGKGPAAGGFLKNLAEAGLRADAANYAILRPVLAVMAVRYPLYNQNR